MKFDMGRAWDDAVRMISTNRQVLAVVAGVFFFLPYLAFMLATAGQTAELEAAAAGQADPEALMAAMSAFYGSIWWVMLLLTVVQAIGFIAMLALLTDATRPTVAQAIKIGAKYFPTYIAAQILAAFAYVLVVVLPVGIGAAISPILAVVLGLIAVVAAVYMVVKFLLAPAVIGIERTLNPVAALQRSWRLTKGNSLRLFGFFLLLLVVIIVIAGVTSLVAGVVFALFGAEVALIGEGIVGSLVNAIWVTVFMAVLAATHRQLAGPSSEAVSETFD